MYDECTLEEVIAYRKLQGETFDFGEGPMKMEGLYGSEDIYYKMFIEKHFKNKKENKEKEMEKNIEKGRLNRYKRKMVDKKKIEKLRRDGIVNAVSNRKPYLRIYKGERSSFLKREANKKVRNYIKNISDGGDYKKIYQLEYNLY